MGQCNFRNRNNGERESVQVQRVLCPAICRFINADDISYLGADDELTGYNLYSYCGNNPVMYADPEGKFINTIIGGILGALIGGITALISGG